MFSRERDAAWPQIPPAKRIEQGQACSKTRREQLAHGDSEKGADRQKLRELRPRDQLSSTAHECPAYSVHAASSEGENGANDQVGDERPFATIAITGGHSLAVANGGSEDCAREKSEDDRSLFRVLVNENNGRINHSQQDETTESA